MKLSTFKFVLALLLVLETSVQVATAATPSAAATPGSKAQQVLDQAAAEKRYTFVLFYKENNAATQAVAKTLQTGVAKRVDKATMCFVSVTDPAEKAVIDRFGAGRSPLPLTIAVAPNGAMTGIFAQSLTDAHLDESFVTPTMTTCMKSMQEGKLVLVCVNTTAKAATPASVMQFATDKQFKDRVAIASLNAADPAESMFLEQMQIDATTAKGTTVVFLAPPGVLIGKFPSTATMDTMAAALHKAGKCCDDPNCKHNKGN